MTVSWVYFKIGWITKIKSVLEVWRWLSAWLRLSLMTDILSVSSLSSIERCAMSARRSWISSSMICALVLELAKDPLPHFPRTCLQFSTFWQARKTSQQNRIYAKRKNLSALNNFDPTTGDFINSLIHLQFDIFHNFIISQTPTHLLTVPVKIPKW